MKRLILMRHAKSDWSGGQSNDHDRPLNPRGRKASAALGNWLRQNDLIPDHVLCSTSIRTQETLLRLDLSDTMRVQLLRPLYLASAQTLLAMLQTAKGNCVLMLGHNPGIGLAAEQLVRRPPPDEQFHQYPTGATLVADFDIAQWSEASWGNAIAQHFVVPRELSAPL